MSVQWVRVSGGALWQRLMILLTERWLTGGDIFWYTAPTPPALSAEASRHEAAGDGGRWTGRMDVITLPSCGRCFFFFFFWWLKRGMRALGLGFFFPPTSVISYAQSDRRKKELWRKGDSKGSKIIFSRLNILFLNMSVGKNENTAPHFKQIHFSLQGLVSAKILHFTGYVINFSLGTLKGHLDVLRKGSE